ncbi:MFS general substrate transporter [Decorospora gaudefroyi]|uniref:MFS general substrate transporter n=1 Tax=Decorospora gaudefroyi TaxID=184978 RepID=A0A6A5KEF4_9PLEO|nr:MFS general substrate transporter [Decorospora gaudefroyi]
MDFRDIEKAQNEERHRESSASTDNKADNTGAPITRTQQWRILSSTCLVAFTVIGLTQSFGVFQAHYGRHESVRAGVLRQSDQSQRAMISTIGSFGNGGLVAIFGAFYYPYLPKLGGHVRSVCAIGAALIALGFAIAAGSRNLATLVGCQGVLVGLGAGILIYVLAPILPEYFPQRSGLAQGAMFAFAALGGTIWVFVLTRLLETIGIRWTLGFLAVISGVVLSIASALALPPRKFETRCTHIVGWQTFIDPMFASLAVVNLIHPLTLAIPMVFGPEFAESIGASVTRGSYLLAINSGVGIPGRLCTGWLADKIGHLNMLMFATAVYAIATWALWLSAAMTSNVGLYVGMCVCHGLVNGVFNTVMNSAQKVLFGTEMYYPKIGATTSIRGLAYVIGIPIAGALVSKVADEELQGDDFVRPIVYTGALLTLSLLCLMNVRWLDAKRNGWKLAR